MISTYFLVEASLNPLWRSSKNIHYGPFAILIIHAAFYLFFLRLEVTMQNNNRIIITTNRK